MNLNSIAYQQTLASTAICAGIGVHSGERARLTLKPAPVGTGIVFKRVDVAEGEGLLPARGDCVHDVTLGTKLQNEFGVTLSTVEHLLAAVYAMGIDNLIIEIDGSEVPIMDGSAALYSDLIRQSGIRKQTGLRKYLRILEPVRVSDGSKTAELLPVEGDAFHLDAFIDFKSEAIGRQRKTLILTPESFEKELAFARTFGFAHELDQLHAMGLGRGASMENAIAVEDGKVLNPEGLRAQDEFVRHKMLDAVGDLALIGYRVIGRYVSEQPGHSINNLLVRKLLNSESAWELDTLAELRPQMRAGMSACL